MSPVSAIPAMPHEHFMCTKAECEERQTSGEISMFESMWPPPATNNNNGAPSPRGVQSSKQSRRIVDPHYAMTKYRRSAAGFDEKNRAPSRSIEQLECCLSQLEYILSYQQKPPPTTTGNTKHPPFPQQTLCGTVGFVEDRIRAIQVDMVVSQQQSAAVQYRIVKCHILILYLLANVATYESTFGQQALSAALTNYWEEQHQLGEDLQENHQQDQERDDDILCIMALSQLSQYYTSGGQHNDNDESLSFLLDYYRRNVQVRRQNLGDFPNFQWALQLVHLAVMGRPQSILRQLAELGGDSRSNNIVKCSVETAVLLRCCAAPVIDILRFQALDQYNKAYMKGEKVHTKELARLLYFSRAGDAGNFAIKMAGLTKLAAVDGGEEAAVDDCKIVFKVCPVSKGDKLGEGRQDEFIFGDLYGRSWSSVQVKNQAMNQATSWDDAAELASNISSKSTEKDPSPGYIGARTDAEGVLVPPPTLLHRILGATGQGGAMQQLESMKLSTVFHYSK